MPRQCNSMGSRSTQSLQRGRVAVVVFWLLFVAGVTVAVVLGAPAGLFYSLIGITNLMVILVVMMSVVIRRRRQLEAQGRGGLAIVVTPGGCQNPPGNVWSSPSGNVWSQGQTWGSADQGQGQGSAPPPPGFVGFPSGTAGSYGVESGRSSGVYQQTGYWNPNQAPPPYSVATSTGQPQKY